MAAALSRVYAVLCRRDRLTSKECPFWLDSLFCGLGAHRNTVKMCWHQNEWEIENVRAHFCEKRWFREQQLTCRYRNVNKVKYVWGVNTLENIWKMKIK
jgi:hypothetical protein